MKMKKMAIIISIIFISLIFTCCAGTPGVLDETHKGNFLGMIYDARSRPCGMATITISLKDKKSKKTVQSDINGRFVFTNIAGGTYNVTAEKSGYETITSEIEFNRRTQLLYIRITSQETLLDEVEKHLKNLEWNKAKTTLERAASVDQNDSRYILLHGVFLQKKGDHQAAIIEWHKLIDKGHKDPYLYLILADTFQYGLEQPDQAIVWLKKFLTVRKDPIIKKRLSELMKEQPIINEVEK